MTSETASSATISAKARVKTTYDVWKLPNITGSIAQGVQAGGADTGALYRDSTVIGIFNNQGTGQQALHFDASLSNTIYSKSTTVQPPSNQVLIVIKT